MNRLSVELVMRQLKEADEVKKQSVAKLKLRNRGTKEIKNPTAAVGRSERHDGITQIVQDGKFNVDVDPGTNLSDDIVPQADFAETYTDKMPHGKTAGMGGNGENQKSPEGIGTENMTPNQTTKLKQVGPTIKSVEDDGDQKVFQIPQADYAETYTDSMEHGRAGGTTNENGADGAPDKRSADQMAGGPTRKGGERKAGLGGDTVGAKNKDTQNITQVTGPGKESSPSDAMKWGSADYKKETHGAHNVVESGVAVTVNGKRKATFEVVNHAVLTRMAENYQKHGYTVEFERTPVTWKQDKKFLALVLESVHARHNHAPNIAKRARKAAMQHFGQLCRDSYNNLYENRHTFVQTMGAAYKKIESLTEQKYLDGLEFFDCMARVQVGEDVVDLEVHAHATDKNMAARNVRNQIQEEFGFDTDIQQIFVDGEKFTLDGIKEYRPRADLGSKK